MRAVALGADAVYCASSALIALGCHQCQACAGGKCKWGIATQRADLPKRLNPEIGAERVVNLVRAWNHEVQELMGGMGINAIDSLRGNRLMLRGVPVASLADDTFDRVPLNIDFPQGAARMHRGYSSTLNELGWPKAEGEE